MKKLFYFVVAFAVTIFGSCTGFDVQPKFVSILGVDEKTVQLEDFKQLEDNSVQLFFSDKIELTDVSVYVNDVQSLCSVEKQIIDGKEVQHINIVDDIEIGESYIVNGIAKSGATTQDFSLNFEGKNTRPADLELSEYKPMGKTKTVKEAEFIELVVTKTGNLHGFKLCSVGSKKQPDYTFPTCEVSEGEIIVVHLHPTNEVNADNNFTDEIGDSTSLDIATARDFYANLGKPARRKTNVVLLENHEERIIDYLMHIHDKQLEEGSVIWDTNIKVYVDKILDSPFKEQFEQATTNPKTVNLTSTVSYAKSGGTWIKTKEITRGKLNGLVKE